MPKIIPLHSLVFCEPVEKLQRFAAHEIVDLAAISRQTVGSTRRHDLTHILYGELRHRIALKLSLGERVVINPLGLDIIQRRQLAALAINQGAEVFSWTDTPDLSLGKCLRLTADIQLAQPLPVDVMTHLRAMGWHGITVVGDVHGELSALEQVLSWARSRNHFVWFLGDVLDYGQQTLVTTMRVHQAVMHGEAAMVLANHERKIARWLNSDTDNHLRISEANRVTIDAYEHLTSKERSSWAGRFRGLLAHTSLTQQINYITLMHGAAHPSYWHIPDAQAIEQYALYGETEQTGGRYRRTHRWVDFVPQGQMVIVGHDIISPYPTIVTGSKGGKVVFLDTGCGKGGQLSSADIRFVDDELKLECFKRY